MEVMNTGHEEFVTVVSVGNNSATDLDNFVTVLSIGNGLGDKNVQSKSTDVEKEDTGANSSDGHPEEEVDVFRLPGERLGFGLKFEGGNKTIEKVRKLFVQSCASESPASRAQCSWGTLGEGDEVREILSFFFSRTTCVFPKEMFRDVFVAGSNPSICGTR